MAGRPKAPPGCYWRGGTLWARKVVAGQEYRRSLQTDDPKIAKKRRANWVAELSAARHGEERLTFQHVLDGWTDWIPHQVGAETVKRYAVSLGQLEPFLDSKYLDEINARLIAEIIAARRARGLTEATIKRDLGALSSVMNFALDQGHAETNPVLPRLERIRERRDPIALPDPADVETVAQRCPGMLGALVRAALATGCRQAELVHAQHRHLDRTVGTLTVIGKGNKMRVVDLSPLGARAIFESLPPGVGKAPLFWHDDGQPYRNLSSRFALIVGQMARAGKITAPFRFHDLRHLHAVLLLRAGWSIYLIQQRLGHSSIKVTEGHYLKYLTPDEAMVAKGLARASVKEDGGRDAK